jgi:threonine aldolase
LAQFGSDNSAGTHPKIIESLIEASSGSAPAYGSDELTVLVGRRLNDLFEREVTVLLMATGTAANCVGLATLCSPFGGIYAHAEAHIVNDESTAPELFTGGARQFTVMGKDAKPDLAELATKIDVSGARGVHSVQSAVISISNLTELGARLSCADIAAYSDLAKSRGMKLFMDGARFANAVAAGSDSPADLTWRSGVDAISFGATKNGAMAAEALIFFNPEEAKLAEFHRKRAGHLWSKHRFLAAQFDAYLHDNLWLELARTANEKMLSLRQGIDSCEAVSVLAGGDGNELFVAMSPEHAETLLELGHLFYAWPSLTQGYRLVTSFTTTDAEIDEFCADLKRL